MCMRAHSTEPLQQASSLSRRLAYFFIIIIIIIVGFFFFRFFEHSATLRSSWTLPNWDDGQRCTFFRTNEHRVWRGTFDGFVIYFMVLEKSKLGAKYLVFLLAMTISAGS